MSHHDLRNGSPMSHHDPKKGSSLSYRRLSHPWIIIISEKVHRRFTDVCLTHDSSRHQETSRPHPWIVITLQSGHKCHINVWLNFAFFLFEIVSGVSFIGPLHHPTGGLCNTTNINQSKKTLHLRSKSLCNTKMVAHMCCTIPSTHRKF